MEKSQQNISIQRWVAFVAVILFLLKLAAFYLTQSVAVLRSACRVEAPASAPAARLVFRKSRLVKSLMEVLRIGITGANCKGWYHRWGSIQVNSLTADLLKPEQFSADRKPPG